LAVKAEDVGESVVELVVLLLPLLGPRAVRLCGGGCCFSELGGEANSSDSDEPPEIVWLSP